MKILILTNKLKIDIKPHVVKWIDFLKENIEEAVIDVTYKEVPYLIDAVRPNTLQYNDQYPVVMYAYDRLDQRPNSTSNAWLQTARMVLIHLATGKIEQNVDYIWKDIAHEYNHGLCFLTGTKDVMDTYLHNDDPRHADGNFARQFKLLKPNLYKIFPQSTPLREVSIKRNKSTSKQTLGTLTAKNGAATFSCNTLELPDLQNKSNVSCIPKGKYECKYTYSPKFKKNTYEVTKVPTRSGIRIHSANYYSDLLGCIALGSGLSDLNKDGSLDVINSRNTITLFEEFMQRKDFSLVIT